MCTWLLNLICFHAAVILGGTNAKLKKKNKYFIVHIIKMLICITTTQDAHKRLVLQVYFGSNTSEFSATLVIGINFVI